MAELPRSLIWTTLTLVGMTACGFALSEFVLDVLLSPIEATLRGMGDPDPTLIFTSPSQYFFVLFRVSVLVGFVLTLPVIVYQCGRLLRVRPSIPRVSAFLKFILAAPGLFLAGIAISAFVLTPQTLQSYFAYMGENVFLVGLMSEGLDLTLMRAWMLGLLFQVPVFVLLWRTLRKASDRDATEIDA